MFPFIYGFDPVMALRAQRYSLGRQKERLEKKRRLTLEELLLYSDTLEAIADVDATIDQLRRLPSRTPFGV